MSNEKNKELTVNEEEARWTEEKRRGLDAAICPKKDDTKIRLKLYHFILSKMGLKNKPISPL